MLPTLWQQFQHDNALVHKVRFIQKWFVEIGVEEHDWPTQSPDLNPIKYVWDELECKPGLIALHQCPTSLMVLWLNGSKSLQKRSNIQWKGFAEEGGVCYSSKRRTNPILRAVIGEN